MPTKTSICNLAVSWVAGNRIVNIGSDDSSEAQICRDNYEDTVKAVLEERAWTFATKRYKWTPLASGPAWGYDYAFQIPSNVLTIREVHENDTYANGANDVDWRREEDKIVCNLEEVYVKVTVNVTDENKFSAQFVQAVAARLAAIMAIPIAESRALQSDMWNLYNNLLVRAGSVDGMQGKNDRISSNQYKKVR
jgi:hypothetical protein